MREVSAQRALWVAALSVSITLMFTPLAFAQGLSCDDLASQQAAQQRLREGSSDPDGLNGPTGEAFTWLAGHACEGLSPPENLILVAHPGDNPVDSSGVWAAPKVNAQKGLPRASNKELLEDGGALPPPSRSAASEASGDSGRFPFWRVAGLILSACVFGFALWFALGFALYRLHSTLQRRL